MKKDELRYLQRLAEIYPTIGKASTEIINLQSILNLPKGTEHFMSDLHGEYQAFSHVLRNGSGAVRKKIDDVFGHTLSNNDKRSLATLIYYPKEKMDLVKIQKKIWKTGIRSPSTVLLKSVRQQPPNIPDPKYEKLFLQIMPM